MKIDKHNRMNIGHIYSAPISLFISLLMVSLIYAICAFLGLTFQPTPVSISFFIGFVLLGFFSLFWGCSEKIIFDFDTKNIHWKERKFGKYLIHSKFYSFSDIRKIRIKVETDFERDGEIGLSSFDKNYTVKLVMKDRNYYSFGTFEFDKPARAKADELSGLFDVPVVYE